VKKVTGKKGKLAIIPGVLAKDQPPTPPPVFDCAVCGHKRPIGNVSVAIVFDTGTGCERQTVHPDCVVGSGRYVVDDEIDALGVF
jgi:hypothetical protein